MKNARSIAYWIGLVVLVAVLASKWDSMAWGRESWDHRLGSGDPKANLLGSEVVTIQPSSADAYVYEGDSSTNFGTAIMLNVGAGNTSAKDIRSVIQFDISSIPPGSTINSAEIQLYLYSEQKDPACTVDMHRITASWAEDTVTWNNQPAHDASVLATTVIDPVDWYVWDGLAPLVQSWLDGTWDNYGVKIKQQTENLGNLNYKWLASNNYTADTTKRPKLIVGYTPPTAEQPYSFIM